MRWVTLVRLPGTGAEDVQAEDSWTVAQFVQQYSLQGRSIIIDGVECAASSFDVQTLAGIGEIVAVNAVKGNI